MQNWKIVSNLFPQVAESKETKMSVSNLARTIGITVVGYSCPDPSPADIMSAVRQRLSPLDIESPLKLRLLFIFVG